MAVKILLSARLGERRLKQAELSRKTGIRPGTVSDIYNEVCKSISLEHLELICDALDCDLPYILVLTKD